MSTTIFCFRKGKNPRFRPLEAAGQVGYGKYEARFLKPGFRMHIIVDGYNLIRQSDVLRLHERQGLEAGRKALVHLLAGYRRSRGHRITVVFDGWLGGPPQEERDREAGIDIIYSRRGEKADEVIKRLARQHADETVVVTSDR